MGLRRQKLGGWRRGKVTEVRLHARVWHTHSGIKVVANAVSIRKRVEGRLRQYKLGVFCPYCGFHPNDNARAMHQRTLEQILARRAKTRSAWRRL